jgi:hypothetical protein
MVIVVTDTSFDETTEKLRKIMEKEEGGLEWSRTHSSCFEISKSAVLHLTRKTVLNPENIETQIPPPRPPLVVNRQRIPEVQSFKYLGV